MKKSQQLQQQQQQRDECPNPANSSLKATCIMYSSKCGSAQAFLLENETKRTCMSIQGVIWQTHIHTWTHFMLKFTYYIEMYTTNVPSRPTWIVYGCSTFYSHTTRPNDECDKPLLSPSHLVCVIAPCPQNVFNDFYHSDARPLCPMLCWAQHIARRYVEVVCRQSPRVICRACDAVIAAYTYSA